MSVNMVCVRVVGEVTWLRGKRWFVLVHCWVSGAAQLLCVLVGCPFLLWWLRCRGCWGGGCVLCENCIVDASIFLFCVLVLFTLIVCVSVCFVTGVWWMPWHAEPMKDV